MTVIKRSIKFSYRLRLKEKKYGSLECVIQWAGNRLRLSVGHNINPDKWNGERCEPRSYHGKSKTPASVINKSIDDLELLIDDLFRNYERIDHVPTSVEFKSAYNDAIKKSDGAEEINGLIKPAFEEYIKEGINTGRWREGTLKKIRTIKKHLLAISPNLTFDDLNRDGMSKIITTLSKLPDRDKGRGLTNPTINKEIVLVKSFVRWAIEKGYCQSNRFVEQRSRLKTTKKVVIFLSWEELMKVYNYDFSMNRSLEQVRDVFCFCCFTSLRYSDVLHLRRANVSDDAIKVTTIKTGSNLTIELNKYSRAILDKYADMELPKDRALPVISNQRMNDYIKKVGELCGIDEPVTTTTYKGASRIEKTYKKWELLSTHAGRRTFISNALMLGISPEIVMKWTGHSDYKAMKPYIDIIDKARREAMDVFNKAT